MSTNSPKSRRDSENYGTPSTSFSPHDWELITPPFGEFDVFFTPPEDFKKRLKFSPGAKLHDHGKKYPGTTSTINRARKLVEENRQRRVSGDHPFRTIYKRFPVPMNKTVLNGIQLTDLDETTVSVSSEDNTTDSPPVLPDVFISPNANIQVQYVDMLSISPDTFDNFNELSTKHKNQRVSYVVFVLQDYLDVLINRTLNKIVRGVVPPSECLFRLLSNMNKLVNIFTDEDNECVIKQLLNDPTYDTTLLVLRQSIRRYYRKIMTLVTTKKYTLKSGLYRGKLDDLNNETSYNRGAFDTPDLEYNLTLPIFTDALKYIDAVRKIMILLVKLFEKKTINVDQFNQSLTNLRNDIKLQAAAVQLAHQERDFDCTCTIS